MGSVVRLMDVEIADVPPAARTAVLTLLMRWLDIGPCEAIGFLEGLPLRRSAAPSRWQEIAAWLDELGVTYTAELR